MSHVELALKNVGLLWKVWVALPSQAPDPSGAPLTPGWWKVIPQWVTGSRAEARLLGFSFPL